MKIRHKVVIDMAKKDYVEVEVTKSSKNTIFLDFYLLDNGKGFDMEEVGAVSFKAIKPDGGIVFNDTVIVEDGKIEYGISESIMNAPGQTVCELQLADENGGIINSFEFYIQVQQALYDENNYISENDLSGIRAYMLRAEKAVVDSENVRNQIVVTYGTLNDIVGSLNSVKEDYVTYIEELQEKVNSGEFNGARGPQGENGADAVVTETKGIMAFQIVGANLVCYYYGDEEPDMRIVKGDLIYSF